MNIVNKKSVYLTNVCFISTYLNQSCILFIFEIWFFYLFRHYSWLTDEPCCYSRQSALVSHLYSGIQCNSCGVRFPPEQTLKYSQHLDWHFRQNRRDRDSTRTVMSRRYYYDVNDWVQFEEIEDLEERGQSTVLLAFRSGT